MKKLAAVVYILSAFLCYGKDRLACVFPLADVSGKNAARRRALTEAVCMEFRAAGFQLVPWEQLQEPSSEEGSKAVIEVARGYGADLAVSGFFTADGEDIILTVSCHDVLGETLIGGFVRSWPFNLGIYNLLHEEIAALIPRLSFAEAPPEAVEAATSAGLTTMTFTSDMEGMEVWMGGDTKVGTVENGQLVLYTSGIRPGTTFRVEKRLDGYHSSWETVQAAQTVALSPLYRKTSYAVELDLTLGQLFGTGCTTRFYIIPDSLFGGVSVYPYIQAPVTRDGSPLLHADLGLHMGYYVFFPADSPFRMGISAGIGGIFSFLTAGAAAPYTDFYINPINIWLELNLRDISIFLRSEMKCVLGIGNDALGLTVLSADNVPPLTLGVMLK